MRDAEATPQTDCAISEDKERESAVRVYLRVIRMFKTTALIVSLPLGALGAICGWSLIDIRSTASQSEEKQSELQAYIDALPREIESFISEFEQKLAKADRLIGQATTKLNEIMTDHMSAQHALRSLREQTNRFYASLDRFDELWRLAVTQENKGPAEFRKVIESSTLR